MNQLQLKQVSKDILIQVEQSVVPARGLPKVVDDYFIQRLKEDELQHAEVDPRLYEGLRTMVKAEVLPLYEQFRLETAKIRERRQKRELWQYVLGTVAVFELLEAVVTRGRSIAPQVLLPMAILDSFIGFVIYTAAQYVDDLQLNRARKRLEKSIEGLERKVQTDADYDNRRQLMDADILRAEALEIMTHYPKASDFWRDYIRVRDADPTLPAEVRALNVPAFERFLKFHVQGDLSAVARQHRYNRLFIEAHEVFLSRDRDHYAIDHLKNSNPSVS
jgi:hypothetical protein